MREVAILGRIVRWTNEGVEHEANPKHRRKNRSILDLTRDREY